VSPLDTFAGSAHGRLREGNNRLELAEDSNWRYVEEVAVLVDRICSKTRIATPLPERVRRVAEILEPSTTLK